MVSRFFAILFLLMSSLFPLFGIKSSEPFISSDKDKKDWSIGGSDATNIKNQDIKIVKIKDSQGFVPPLIKGESIIFLDIKGYLRFANLRSLEETLVVPLYHPGFMSAGLAFSGNIVYCSIDNLLYAINSENGKLLWSKELRTRVAGEPTVFNGKVSVLTIDNYLYVFDSKNGNLLWSYQGVLIEQKSLNSASPSFSKDKNILLAPFSNGELLAFSESDGRKLWVQKFTGDFLKNPLNDINISPRIASGHAIVSSKSNKVCF